MGLRCVCPGCGLAGLHPTAEGCILALQAAIAREQQRGIGEAGRRAIRRQRIHAVFMTDETPGTVWRKAHSTRKPKAVVLTRKAARWKVIQHQRRLVEQVIARTRVP